MRDKMNVEKIKNAATRQQPDKKPYAKPQIIYQGVLEAMAAVCLPAPPGKSVPGIGGCSTAYS